MTTQLRPVRIEVVAIVAVAFAILMIALVAPSGASAAECTNTWVGPAEGEWATASNWSAEHVPTESEVACIGSGKTVKVTSGAGAAVLQGEGSIVVSANLELLSSTEPSTIGSLTVNGGGLGGPATLEVLSTFNWTAESVMYGPGSTVLAPGVTGTASATGIMYLDKGRHLVNKGTLTMSAGRFNESEGSVIENTGTFNANSEHIQTFRKEGAGSLVNSGTFRKTSGTGTTEIGVSLENNGLVEAQQGTLMVGDGSSGSAAEWIADEEAQLFFFGTYTLTGGSLSGLISLYGNISTEGVDATAADVKLNGGWLTVPSGTQSLNQFTIEGGGVSQVSGPGNLAIESSFSWSGEAVMWGPGSTILRPGAVGTATAERVQYLATGRHFVNEGTFTMSAGQFDELGGAVIENTGTFNANSERFQAFRKEEGAGSILNRGAFRKTAGTGTTEVNVYFANEGSVQPQTGELLFPFPVTAPGSHHFSKECNTADPVNCATGDFSESQTDIAIDGLGVGLNLTRTYSAQAAAEAASPGAFGYGWTASFSDHLLSEEEGKRITLFSADGGTVPFAKSGASYNAPIWSQDTLSGSSEAGYTLTMPNQTKYAFSGEGRLEKVTDRNGNETTLSYTEAGQLETITDPAGREITLTYNGSGQVESAEDPMGHVVTYGYESGQLTSVTMPGEAEPRWQFKYDGSHRIAKVTNGRGGKTTNEYDGLSRVISQTDPAERTTTFEYAPFHTRITNVATGAVTDEWFTSNHEPFSITRGFGTESATTKAFAYNGEGRLLSTTDGNGHKTTYSYDSSGNRKSEKDAAGDEAKWVYNETHNVISMTTPREETTTITRDANGNPETISRPAPGATTQTSSYEFGVHGELKSMTDPLERTWSFEYDSYGDRKAATDPEGDKRTWVYDEDSHLTSTVSPRGNEEGAEPSNFTTTIKRDAQGRPEEAINPLKGATKYTYDPDGNLKTETDPNSHKTTFTYDADDEQTKVEKPNGDVLETGYDGAGQVTSQTDGNKHTTTYVRNVLEEPIEVIDPLERKTTEEYDAAGNLKATTDPSKRKTSYAYDAANRLKEISYSEGGMSTVKFGHDKDGNLTNMSDGTGESSSEYDQLGRLIHSKDGHGDTVDYEYNLGNEKTGITYPNGESITRAFDKAGRLKSITDWLGHTTTFAYNRDSEPKSTTFPTATGNLDEYAYDRADRVSEVKMKKGAEALASVGYTREKVGQVESLMSKGLPGAETESFSYDENERLTKAGAGSYEYDAASNLTKAPGTTNKYDAGSQLETGTGTTYAYNEEGERTKLTPSEGPATTYKYDQAGDLSAVERSKEGEIPAISESYAYDGTGLRASQTVSGTTSHLTWDDTALPLILNDGQNSYIYGPSGLPIEQISSGETPTYLHHDQLGSTRALTNATGEVSATFTYGAYGKLEGHTGTTSLGFAGQYTDSQSGLQYLRARIYDPATGQFLTTDPLAALTRAPYSYADSSPLTFVDPSGLGACVLGFIDCDESDDPCDSVASGPMIALCLIPESAAPTVVDASAGLGDELLAPPLPGIEPGPWLREQLGIDNVEDCSLAYSAGKGLGMFASLARGVAGGADAIGRYAPDIYNGSRDASRGLNEKFVHVDLP